MEYAELHCKTNYSFLEGASHPEELVQEACGQNYAALAITDRESLAGVVRAHVAAKNQNLKLIIGAEIHPSDAPAVLLWSHGNAGNVGNRVEIVLALAERNLGVLAYDYRGYGYSEGSPGEAGVYRDAEAAYDGLRASGVPAGRIVCFGESLGGAVSIWLATERPCAGVAVVATFTSLREVARAHYGLAGAAVGSGSHHWQTSTPATRCRVVVASQVGHNCASAPRSSSQRRTSMPCSAASWRASRQQTPISP